MCPKPSLTTMRVLSDSDRKKLEREIDLLCVLFRFLSTSLERAIRNAEKEHNKSYCPKLMQKFISLFGYSDIVIAVPEEAISEIIKFHDSELHGNERLYANFRGFITNLDKNILKYCASHNISNAVCIAVKTYLENFKQQFHLYR